MAGTAVSGRLTWTIGDIVNIRDENERTRTLVLRVPGWRPHRPGQHVDIRLTAEDGYRVERSYSIASAPSADQVEITVERLDDGEVSPYLTEELRPGDKLELRGPIGGYFTWQSSDGGPLFLIGGGSGIVPLMSMLRHRAESGTRTPTRLLGSYRTENDIVYRNEIDTLAVDDPDLDVTYTLTRSQPPGWSGYSRRIDSDMLATVGWPSTASPRIFICGPTSFVEAAASALVDLGHDPECVRTERFGPSGG